MNKVRMKMRCILRRLVLAQTNQIARVIDLWSYTAPTLEIAFDESDTLGAFFNCDTNRRIAADCRMAF